MTIEELLKKNRDNRPTRIRKGKPESRVKRPSRSVVHSGATIGDGMRTTAKVAAATTLLTILIHSAPALLAATLGSFLLFRGCSQPAPIPLQPVPMHTSLPDLHPPTIHAARSTVAPSIQKLETNQVANMLAEQFPDEIEVDSHEHLVEFADIQPSQDSIVSQFQPQLPFTTSSSLAPSSPLLPVPLPTFADNSPANTSTRPVPAPNIDTTVFDLRRGKTYLGTCQMSRQASKRMSLSITEIRDRGTNIQAKLTLLESPRTTKKFTGTVENNPPRLILTPLSEGNGFGTFVTYLPWYSNSPTAITLEMSKDGMHLEGTSGSTEQFDLWAQAGVSDLAHSVASPSNDTDFNGFDPTIGRGTTWSISQIDSRSAPSAPAQTWVFTSLEEGIGTFVWTQGSKILSSGTYKEGAEANEFDIIIMKGMEQQVYRGRIQTPVQDNRLRVCVSKEQNAPRPTQISSVYGRVYELVLSGGRER